MKFRMRLMLKIAAAKFNGIEEEKLLSDSENKSICEMDSPKNSLILLASHPGVGKKSFALSLAAKEMALHHRQVVFLIDDSSGIDVTEIASEARRLNRDGKLDLLIIDSLNTIKWSDAPNCSDAINKVLCMLKALAKELQIRIIVLDLLDYLEGENVCGRPQLSDIRDQGIDEQNTDAIWLLERKFIWTNRIEDERSAELIIVNSNSGTEKVVPLCYDVENEVFVFP